LHPRLRFFCDEGFKNFGESISCAVSLKSSGLVDKRNNSYTSKPANKDFALVRASLPNAVPEQIYGFATEGEAARWIKNESVVWLNERRERLKISRSI
jgi:hypothetical protein